MDGSEYWVEISQHGMRLGAGFLLAKRFVLIALHCLYSCASGNNKVELSFATGHTIHGLVCERSYEADLALITITGAGTCPASAPFPDRSVAGDAWRAPYRPSRADPYLSGGVQHGSVRYQCEGGGSIEALQLGCAEHLGDYSGYSGGPVERDQQNGERVVLGILIEQYPDRQMPKRASNVLFAATIAEALRQFDYFDVWHLYNVLCPDESGHELPSGRARIPAPLPDTPPARHAVPGSVPTDWWKVVGDRMYAALRGWAESGLLDQTQIAMLNYQIAKTAIDKAFGDGANE